MTYEQVKSLKSEDFKRLCGVLQDPNDEPAEKLIERIKQEKLHGKNGKQLELEIS